jgi:protein-glutamine gamma-glutamyltransferase
MWSISRLSLLTVCVSAAGSLSLALSGLLPWPAFLVLAGVHVWAVRNFSRVLPVTTRQVMLVTALFFLMEIVRILVQGTWVIPFSLRDIIVYFAVLRLVLPKTGREIYQVVAIGLAQCILSTIFTTSPLFLIGLVLMGVLIPMTLSMLDKEDFGHARSRRQGALHWILVYTGIATASCILFFLIPRPASTLIRYAVDSQGKKGFSEETNLSREGEAREDRQILMRIFWTRGQAPAAFYLPGSRLDALTDNGFTKGSTEKAMFLSSNTGTDRLTVYQTDLESLNVFYPFRISDVSPPSVIFKGLNLYWAAGNPPVYEVWVDRSGDRVYRPSLSVPEGLQGIAALGRRIGGDHPPKEQAERLVRYLGSHCSYALEGQRVPARVSPIPWFVQVGRRGNCEHFASALGVMLRGCGIPARVVTGFLVHEYNPAGGYFIVRASDAHAWAEFYAQGSWHTCEATPQSLNFAGHGPSLLDAIRFAWIRWVIRYSLNDQINLAMTLSPTPGEFEHKVAYALGASFCIALLALALWLIPPGMRKGKAGPYGRVVRALDSKGLHLALGKSHEEHLEQVTREWPALELEFRTYLESYLSWRFGQGQADVRLPTVRILKVIKVSTRPKAVT